MFEYHTEDSELRLLCAQIACGNVEAAQDIYAFVSRTAKHIGENLTADEYAAQQVAAKAQEAA